MSTTAPTRVAPPATIGWSPDDGWTPEWRAWFVAPARPDPQARIRAARTERAVRGAVAQLSETERAIILQYYYDGRSLAAIGDRLGFSLLRMQVLHRRALGRLRRDLTPMVRMMFGVDAPRHGGCAICSAPWRAEAEELLDEKTPDMTWGEVARRLARAVGWHTPSPQTLIIHQKHHRRFAPIDADEDPDSGMMVFWKESE
jgi:hypothetical protein